MVFVVDTFFILSAKNAISVWLIVGYNLITYPAFPIIFDAYPSSSDPLILAGLLTNLMLMALMFLSVKNFKAGLLLRPYSSPGLSRHG